jgi:acetoacetyl-CoA synthetase
MTPERAFPLWLPDPERAADSVMQRFFRSASTRPGAPAPDALYTAWHAWSVAHPEHFWRALYHFGQVQGEHYRPETPSERISSADFGPEDILERGDLMAPPAAAGRPGPRWFRRTHLNYAERVISADGDTLAIVARDETGAAAPAHAHGVVGRGAPLRGRVSRRRCGARGPRRRVPPQHPRGGRRRARRREHRGRLVLLLPRLRCRWRARPLRADRPKVLIVADGYRYGGKRIDCIARTAEIVAALPSVEPLVVVPFLGDAAATAARAERLPTSTTWDAFLERGTDAPLVFERVPFDHPLFIMYSSGTTGLPKCMVHGHGGTILQHLKEHLLHGDLQLGERIFYFTTCGWMMWNWLLSALAAYATIILYDGAPLPDANPAILWDLAAEEEVAVFGTSAKFLAMSEKLGLAPARTHDLRALRMILSTEARSPSIRTTTSCTT